MYSFLYSSSFSYTQACPQSPSITIVYILSKIAVAESRAPFIHSRNDCPIVPFFVMVSTVSRDGRSVCFVLYITINYISFINIIKIYIFTYGTIQFHTSGSESLLPHAPVYKECVAWAREVPLPLPRLAVRSAVLPGTVASVVPVCEPALPPRSS